MERRAGLIPLYLDDRQGRLFLEIPRDSMRVLAFFLQSTGLGSNPIGIDRGANGPDHVARFERNGDRVLVVFENWSYRGESPREPGLATTVAESFPASTVAALPLLAVEGGRLLVDATDFVYRDWLDVAGTLARSNEGTYAFARDRSSVDRAFTKGFPENTEIDVALTFAAQGRPGGTVSSIVPDGRAFTLRQHISVRAAAGRRLSAAPARSARRLFRDHVQGLLAADPGLARTAVDLAAPARAREP